LALDPLSGSESRFWELRRRGLGFADIGRETGVTRQAVYKALLKADREMSSAFEDVAGTYRIDLEKMDPETGIAVGYSQALGSKVVLAYSPGRGIITWYEYQGQCNDCARREDCLSTLRAEAERLDLTRELDWDREPAEIAEELMRRAWPEGFGR